MTGLLRFLTYKSALKRVPFVGWALVRSKKVYNRVRNAALLALGRYPTVETPLEDAPWDYEAVRRTLTVPVVSPDEMAGPERRVSYNKLCDFQDFFAPEFRRVYTELVEPVGDLDRRSWEYVEGVLGLERLGVVECKLLAFDGFGLVVSHDWLGDRRGQSCGPRANASA